jgi:hypothetical protein
MWGEKATLAAIFLAPLLSRNVGMPTHIPVAIFATMALLGIIAVRAQREKLSGTQVLTV